MKETVLRVENLSKIYQKGTGHNDLRQEIVRWFGVGRSRNRPENNGQFYALKDINFELKKGEVLGIIGHNGAGKSTLLKILSRITPPSEGQIEIKGRSTSILNIGTGFHPDLTGRENVFLNGTLLGMSHAQIKANFDQIVEFSGIGDFIESPVKHYSSGMYLRLAFAVAFHSDIDILFLDEVITVGDASFQMKSYERILNLSKEGCSIIVVSHVLNDIMGLCNRCILLDKGQVSKVGAPMDVIEAYMSQTVRFKGSISATGESKKADAAAQLLQARVKALGKAEGEPILMTDGIEMEFLVEKTQDENSVEVTFHLYDMSGMRITLDSPGLRPGYEQKDMAAGRYRFTCLIPANTLNRGVFSIAVSISLGRDTLVDHLMNATAFKVHVDPEDSAAEIASKIGTPWRPHLLWTTEQIE